MGYVYEIVRFGFPYLRRYWLRFTLGIFFGFIFGLSNGFTMGGIYLMLSRLDDPGHAVMVTDEAKTNQPGSAGKEKQEISTVRTIHTVGVELKERVSLAVDPWLPLHERPLDWKQVVGGVLLIPMLTAFRGLMNYATTYLMSWAGERISNDVRADVFRKISSLSLDFFHRSTTAELISRISYDTLSLNTCLRLGLSDLIKEPFTIVFLFVGLPFY